MNEYITTIGLEVHVQLNTKSKLFCDCQNRFGDPPNTNTCPICLGHPGTLPRLNKKAVTLGALVALTLNCKLNHNNKFDRKNYFYPDLPKGFQISQLNQPIGEEGYLEFLTANQLECVRITRCHLEEDAGKLIHEQDKILIDLNRAGAPLVEIVTKAELKSPAAARDFLKALKTLLQYLDASDCNMEQGSLRCDGNISLRKNVTDPLGEKVEIKNMNSFRALEQALIYEQQRQKSLLDTQKTITQETRAWDEVKQKTFSMRSKEEASDYRYFPETDLPAINLSSKTVEKIKAQQCEMPLKKLERFQQQYQLDFKDAKTLTAEKALADFFEIVAAKTDSIQASRWILGDLLKNLHQKNITIAEADFPPQYLIELITAINNNIISGKMAKTILASSFDQKISPQKIIQDKNLAQITDQATLSKIVQKVIRENPEAVQDFLGGRPKILGFLVGQVMKKTKGKANPELVNSLFKKHLKQ